MVNYCHDPILKQVYRKGISSDQFFIYVNDLVDEVTKNARLFADTISLFSVTDKMN